MLFKAKCYYCDSEDLRVINIILGAGTEGEVTEKVFKCNSCDEELCLDEVEIEEIEVLLEGLEEGLQEGLQSAT